MGFYIEVPGDKFRKAQNICREHGAKLIKFSRGVNIGWEQLERVVADPDTQLIAVVHNAHFDAAKIVYDDDELELIRRSAEVGDSRPISWLVLSTEKVKELNPHVPV